MTSGGKKFGTGAGGLGLITNEATYNLCMQKVQGKFTELTGGGMK